MDNPRLVIELMPDGSVNVTGPLPNKILCYGLLESAKEVIQNVHASPVTHTPFVAAKPDELPRFNGDRRVRP